MENNAAFDARQFRNALGRFASGVTVITTQHEDHMHGMTASAFMSVSLSPPLIAVAVDNRAHLNQLLPVGRMFGVSVLADEQAGLSDHFAGRGQAGLNVAFVLGQALPLIQGAVAHLGARVVEARPAGDHTLYLGQVEFLDWRDGMPLVFYAGKYQKLRPAHPIASPRAEDELSLFSIGYFDPSIPEIPDTRPP